jgi:GT2 family glycosyltransferase
MEKPLSNVSPDVPGGLVSCIVVSALKEDMLADCLLSVSRQTYPIRECFVFLNGVLPQDALSWQRRFPKYHFFPSACDALYCRPQNEGIAKSKGAYCLCLNDDVILDPAYIEHAVKAMAVDVRVGIISGCLLRPDAVTVDSAGLIWSRSRKPHDRGYGQKKKVRYGAGFVFGVNGAAAFYRRKMLEDIREGSEYFDESYGIYYEDLDVSWRAQKKGWKAFYCPDAVATHRRGATTRARTSAAPLFLRNFALVKLSHDLKVRQVRNRYAVLIKNDDWRALLRDLPFILFYEIRLWTYLLFFDRHVLSSIFKDRSFFSSAFAKRRLARTP